MKTTSELESENKWDVVAVVVEITALREQLDQAGSRITELERRLRIPFGKLPCALCGGPHDFDTSLPSVIWNRIIRAKGLPEYLCTTCIVREFVKVGQGFTAELWGEGFNGVNIEVVVNGQNAKDASAIQEENNALRRQLAQVTQERDALRDSASIVAFQAHQIDGQIAESLTNAAATRMREACDEAVNDFFTLGQQEMIQKYGSHLLTEVIPSLTLEQGEQEKQ